MIQLCSRLPFIYLFGKLDLLPFSIIPDNATVAITGLELTGVSAQLLNDE